MEDSPESLRHQAGEDRMQEVGEKKKEKEKKTLLLMTKLDAGELLDTKVCISEESDS